MLTPLQVAARAAYVLRGNDVASPAGSMTKAAPALYPHQWSWDAAFVAIGLARVDVARACTELDTLFRGQWRTGMLPHIVFSETACDYFPDAARWGCAEVTEDAPGTPRTSGICQPPVHALAAERILAVADERGGDDAVHARAWLARAYPRLLAWHRYLASSRDPDGTGLLAVHHGWESGMDNSPRWDAAYEGVVVGADLPPYERRDLQHIDDPRQRPSTQEYERYLWIVEELKRAGYDDGQVRRSGSFLVTDVFMSAIFAAASDALARLAQRLDAGEVAELRAYGQRFRDGVVTAVDPELGLALDTDLRTGERVRVRTLAGFAPLVSGGLAPDAQQRMVALLESPQWTGCPELRWPVVPSTSPASSGFQPRTYWRGPTWPVMNWLFWWSLLQRGEQAAAARLRDAALSQLAEGSLAEYYEPFTGEWLGSVDQSWTAAVALDWLCDPFPSASARSS
ncbi:MAG: glycogen debranching protein [Actinomycetota bacterium]|nr:glycogen debranching protein [Actinomycetota bacterium]